MALTGPGLALFGLALFGLALFGLQIPVEMRLFQALNMLPGSPESGSPEPGSTVAQNT